MSTTELISHLRPAVIYIICGVSKTRGIPTINAVVPGQDHTMLGEKNGYLIPASAVACEQLGNYLVWKGDGKVALATTTLWNTKVV